MKIRSIFLPLFLSLAVNPLFADEFAIAEHREAGQQILLKFSAEAEGEKGRLLHLPNGLALSYGDILGLGDLYGLVGQPVSAAKTRIEQERRFRKAFATLASEETAVQQANRLKNVLLEEAQALQTGMAKGEDPEHIYHRIGNEIGRKLNCLTGGGCGEHDWWLVPGRYLLLALDNEDHFYPYTRTAYQIGHRVAMQQAARAHLTGNRADLELAYALDAYAAHFLSDNFSAGHLRTPRLELKNAVKPASLGSLLANYMHNEENHYGLAVRNDLGYDWVSYGDFAYFSLANQSNREMLHRALQVSADEVFQAYYTGVVSSDSQALSWSPSKIIDLPTTISPMFVWDSKKNKLLRRQSIENPYDKHWTADWWGWSTYVLLKKVKGLTVEAYNILLDAQVYKG